MPVADVTQDGVRVSILSVDGQIHAKDNALQIKFQDAGGHPVDAENVKMELNMNMPGRVRRFQSVPFRFPSGKANAGLKRHAFQEPSLACSFWKLLQAPSLLQCRPKPKGVDHAR